MNITKLTRTISRDQQSLRRQCDEIGANFTMYKILKEVVHLTAMFFAAFMVNEGLDPVLAVGFAALILMGPAVFEWYLSANENWEYTGKPDDPE